ncbi:MAG: phosphatase PAP2 family protein [SAR324 cluster bacterium]|nr:phosphatase PAP2 family protein [SAR324 cluster bacterium]
MSPHSQTPLPYGAISLLVTFMILMIGISFIDYEGTLYLIEHRWSYFADIMRRSMFEGGGLGGSDPAVFYLLFALIGYGLSCSPQKFPRLQPCRCFFGFVTFTSALAGLGMVHTIKWSIGRARPHEVIKQGVEYTDWYEFGAHYVAEGIFFGSFPSGHTAIVAIFLTLAYTLIGDPLLSNKWRVFGWIWGGTSLGYAIAMIVARAMSKAHWITDSLGALLLVWGLTHVIYFWVLRIPEQRLYYQKYQKYPDTLSCWEVRLGLHFLVIAIGAAFILIGLQAFYRQTTPWLACLLPPGGLLVFAFSKKFKHLHHVIHKAYQSH